MDNSEDNMNEDKIKIENNPPEKEKPKKRSLVERELETSLTAKVTSPRTNGDGTSTSRYGRARRQKINTDFCDTEKTVTNFLKSPQNEKSPNRNGPSASPVYKMQASNSLIHENSPKNLIESDLENQIENIYNTNISLSRFGSEEKNEQLQSPAKKFSKVYMRKDLIQSKEKDDSIVLKKSIFSPARSVRKSNSHLSNVLERSSEKYDLCKPQNGYLDTASVVKTLDFDCSKKKKKDNRETKSTLSKSDIFEWEAKCAYQLGDIAWARMGTFPFWPCIVTREPGSDMFVRKKLFGKIERDTVHVTFFGDNGRRSWIVDTMMRKYQGLDEFETARDELTPEAKKKDPRLYAAFLISDKKLALWHTAIEEADYIQREPKRLRIDLLNELLGYPTLLNTPLNNQKSSKVTRTDSDVSLSESLYDSLFCIDDGKIDESRPKKNKPLDVSEVVTACLDNMAAKTGLTMIQRQSHMDIWLQKAKSQTPEKSQLNVSITVERLDRDNRKSRSKERDTNRKSKSKEKDNNHSKKKKKVVPPREGPIQKPYSFRKSTESQHLLSYQNEHDYSKNVMTDNSNKIEESTTDSNFNNEPIIQCDNSICVIDKIESLCNLEAATKEQDEITTTEIYEETIIATDIQNEEVTADISKVDDTSSALSQLNTMDIEDNEIQKDPMEKFDEAKLKSDNNSETKDVQINEEIANKTADAFISETDAHVAEPPILKVDQPNSLKTDDKDDSKENKDKDTIPSVVSPNNVADMSIDEDGICQENANNGKDQNETSQENLQQSIQQESIIFQVQLNETQQNEANVDMNILANVAMSFKSNLDNFEVQSKSQVSKKVDIQTDSLVEEDKSVVTVSKVNSSINEQITENFNDLTIIKQNSTLQISNDIVAPNSECRDMTFTNKNGNIEETSMTSPGHQVTDVNHHKMIPKITLTVIKESNIKSFKITSPKSEEPKRRSLRKIKNKKEELIPMKEPEFLQYLELRQDAIKDEYPELNQTEIVDYLYKTWQFGTDLALKRCSGIRKSMSPTDFTAQSLDGNVKSGGKRLEMKGPDAKLTKIKEDTTKKAANLSVNQISEPKRSSKRSFRLRKSQSPSGPEKISESNSSEDERTRNKQAATNNIDSKISIILSPKHDSPPVNNGPRSEDSITKVKKGKPKDIYIVTPKKRSLCLRISKASLEPKVILERKDIINNIMKDTYKMDVKISPVDKVASKALAFDDKIPVHEINSKTDTTEASHSELDKKRSCRRLRGAKSCLEAQVGLEDRHEYKIPMTDETVSKSTAADTQIRNETISEKIPVIENCHSHDVEIEANLFKIRSKKLPKQNQNEKSKTYDELVASQSKSEMKLSLRRFRKSKSSIEIGVSEDKQTNKMSAVDELDCKLKEGDTQVHNEKATSNATPVIEDVSSETDAELEGKRCSDKQPELKESKSKIDDELETSSESKCCLRRSQQAKSCIEAVVSENKQEDDIPIKDNILDCKPVKVDTQVQNKILTEYKTPLNEDVSFETSAELELPLAQRRSLRLRRSQSSTVKENQESSDNVAANVTETKETLSKEFFTNESVISMSQNKFSNNTIVPVESMDTDEQEDAISTAQHSVDNISLASDLTVNFVDHSSDKDFDPDMVSVNSLSSEISDVSVLPQITKALVPEKNIIFQKLLDSDNDSMTSSDDITLSELKIRPSKEETIRKLRDSVENSMDSIKSDTSERRLRLVLTDCLLDAKDVKLPVIKEVNSKTDGEFEISQSGSNINTSKNQSSSISKSSSELKVNCFHDSKTASPEPSISRVSIKIEEPTPDPDTISIISSSSEASVKRRGKNRSEHKPMEEPEFLQYLEMRQDALMDEHPEVSPDEAIAYLYKTWQYEESLKSDIKKNDEIESSNLVKDVNRITKEPPKKKKVTKQKKLINIEKILAKSTKEEHFIIAEDQLKERELPKRKASKPFYKEDYSDIEEEIEMFEIFKTKKKPIVLKSEVSKEAALLDASTVKLETETKSDETGIIKDEVKTSEPKDESIIDLNAQEEIFEEYYDEEELYFEQLTSPKPNVFKGLIREKVCEICEKTSNLVKCKGCSGMFHIECVNKEDEIFETPAPTRGRKKKKKPRGRKPKSSLDSNEESHSDEKSQDLNVSEENMSIEEVKSPEPIVIPDADNFETQLEAKMKEIIETVDKIEYDSYSSDDGIDWSDTVAGKCEIVDVKLKSRSQSVNNDDFKCKNCQKDDTPICFVCKAPVSPKNNVERRQKCQVAHCHKYYHLECLDQWPQTQFNAGEPSRSNKKIDEHFEAMACPRHVCHTCVCDDPRGCKTRFSGDKLARCVRCPATYHSFTKCLPAGSQILSASHIVCPRHYQHRPGKIPYHVNTGWCFICALGGNLICCDYCPTSFHADCLNIEPPEGGYMCEDCETGRLPLYGEMVWVKLGHYRWWPGIVLHPTEIPDNIMAVKHSPGEFVVRFFGQYDHYWVNRGRVFPFQEGDSGKVSTQKSKIDEAFTKAMEHAQRAFEILKNVEPNDEENQDIQSSLLPPHYVKLKVNKPCGALYGRKVDIEESSLTQCECNPDEEDPCGPYSHCLNRMLLTECGPICRAGERCQNRAFEKRQYPKLVPYRTPHRGWGLKTLEPIKAGQFVIEYVGELIDEAEFRRRMQRKHETRDENFYFLTLDKERLIDAGPKGNLARFMNHCCEPNCETQKWTVLGDVRVGLFALHDIPANTEVTFNYNLECTGIEKKQCMCGARRCAGYIGAKPKQEDPQPKKLKPAKRTYKKRKNTDSPSTSQKPKRPVGRPAKPRELTDIEKDLLIIKNASNGISSDSECSGRLSVDDRKDTKALKRKVSFSSEELVIYDGCSSPSAKRLKLDEDEKNFEVGDSAVSV